MFLKRGRVRHESRSGFLISSLLLAAVLLGCSTVPEGRISLHEKPWIEVKTKHFSLWTDASEQKAIWLANRLESFRFLVEFVLGRKLPESRIPTRMVHFADFKSYSQVAPKGSVGVFFGSMRENLMLSSGQSMATIQHEYVHLLFSADSRYQYPRWYQEGFAEFLGATRFRALDVEIGGLPDRGPPVLEYRGRERVGAIPIWAPIEEILASGVGRKGGEMQKFYQFYPQSWALVHYLYLVNGLTRNSENQVAQYLKAVARGAEIEEAVRASFGMTLGELNARLRAYVAHGRYRPVVLKAKRFEPTQAPTVSVLNPSDVALDMGHIAVRSRHRREARAYYERVLAARPEDGRARVALAMLELPKEPDAEFEALLREQVVKNPQDAYFERTYGDVLNFWATNQEEDAAERKRLARLARKHYVASWKLDDSVPETYAAYGGTYLLEGEETEKALKTLRHAEALLPASVWILSSLAQAHLKLGDEAEARRYALRAYAVPRYGTLLSKKEFEKLEAVLERTGGIPRGQDH